MSEINHSAMEIDIYLLENKMKNTALNIMNILETLCKLELDFNRCYLEPRK